MKLTIATGDYAHTRPLQGGRVDAEGDGVFDINWVCDRPGAIFRRTFDQDAPYDVAEMSLATTWALSDRGVRDFVALPVFPSRMYRLSGFYVRDDVVDPKQLAGGRVGVVRYGQTAAVWSRAVLQHDYGIDIAGIEWWVAERQPIEPEKATIRQAQSHDDLESMLADGALDCLIATSVPAVFTQGRVHRLFSDWAERERSDHSNTGFVPIMHTLLIRRSLAETCPRLPAAVVDRFEAAKRSAFAWLRDTDASSLPVPLHHGWVENAFRGGVDDPWPYGLSANRPVLDRFAGYMHEQGLTRRQISPEEVYSATL